MRTIKRVKYNTTEPALLLSGFREKCVILFNASLRKSILCYHFISLPWNKRIENLLFIIIYSLSLIEIIIDAKIYDHILMLTMTQILVKPTEWKVIVLLSVFLFCGFRFLEICIRPQKPTLFSNG